MKNLILLLLATLIPTLVFASPLDLASTQAKIKDLSSDEIVASAGGTITTSAINFQTVIYPGMKKLDIQKYMDMFTKNFNITTITQEFMPLIIAVGLGIVFAILNIIVGVIFWICRCCCNNCGGRRPRKGGYTRYQIISTSIMLFIISAVLIACSLLIIIYSASFPKTITSIKDSIVGISDSLVVFTDSLSVGGKKVGVIIDKYVNTLNDTVAAVNINGTINAGLGLVVNEIFGNVKNISASIKGVKTGINSTKLLVSALDTKIANLNVNADGIKTAVDACKQVTILGTNYSISGLPTISAFSSKNLSEAIDLTAVTDPIDTMPDLDTLANTFKDNYDQTIGGIPSLLTTTINSFVDSFRNTSMYSSFKTQTSDLGSSFSFLTNMTSSLNEKIESFYDIAITYDAYRNYAFLAISCIILVAFTFAIIAVLFQKGVIAEISKPTSICMGFFVWILYTLFFVLAFVLNTLQLNLDATISAGPAPKIDIFNTTSDKDMKISILSILDSCSAPGTSIFNATINGDLDTIPSLIGAQSFFQSSANKTRSQRFVDFIGLKKQMDGLNVSSAVAFDSPDLGNIDAVLNLNISGLTSINVNVSSPMNLTQVKLDIDNVASSLGPEYFWADCTAVNINANVTDLNTKIRNVNAQFSNDFTAVQIRDQFVIGSATFTPATYTLDSNAASAGNQAVQAAYDSAFYLINFNYSSTLASNTLKQSLSNVKFELDMLSANLTSITNTVSNIQANIDSVLSIVDATKPMVLSIKNKVNGISTTIGTTVTVLKDLLVDKIQEFLGSMYEDLLSALMDYSGCAPIANSLGSVLDALLFEFGGHINLFWFIFFLLGIFLFMGFITAVKASKRLGSKKKIAPEPSSGKKAK